MTNDLCFHWTLKRLFLFQVFVGADFREAMSRHPTWALSQTWLRKHGLLRRQIAKTYHAKVYWSGGKSECSFDLMSFLLWCDFTNFKQYYHDCTSVACSNEASPMFGRLENLDSECGDKMEEKNTPLDSWTASWKIFCKVIFTFATRLVNNLNGLWQKEPPFWGEHNLEVNFLSGKIENKVVFYPLKKNL